MKKVYLETPEAIIKALKEWEETDPFYQNLVERITLCLNYCKDKTNEELKG